MTIEQTIIKLVEAENRTQMDSLRIGRVPIWGILRYKIRRKYMLEHGVCENLQSSRSLNDYLIAIKYLLKSFFSIHKLLLFPCHVNNLIMGFSRPEKIGNKYIDKFIDPIIECTKLANDYICFEYGKGATHKEPRVNPDRIIYTEYLYLLAVIYSAIWSYLCLLKYSKEIKLFNKHLKSCYGWNVQNKYIAKELCEFQFLSWIYSVIIKRIKAKRVFGVSRILFRHVIYAAKKVGIPVYEFQHGITLGPTELYSGNYVYEIDPDFFLLFGESCPKDVFGIPESKIMNVGWAFKNYIKSIGSKAYQKGCCLVVSEPQISNSIIDTTITLAQNYPEIVFHIRRHPQEKFSEEQYARFSSIPNIIDSTNRENSMLVTMAYDYIIGENSTVIFEALSLGKKVARLNICGLHPTMRDDNDGFYYIDSVHDFGYFLSAPSKNQTSPVYSDFNKELFNSFLR